MSRLLALFISLFLSVVLVCGSGPVHADNDDTGPGPIVVLGDSLSAEYGFDRARGWVVLLRERLQARGDERGVVNASVSGDTTRGGVARLPGALQNHEPSVVIIQLGGNDGLRGFPPDEVRRNLREMIRLSREAGARVLLVGVRLPPNYGPAYTEAFAAAFATVARETDAALVPGILAGVAERDELMQDDGIHPTAEAQPVILDNIWAGLEPLLAPQND